MHVYGHCAMAGSSSDDAFEPNNWVYDTGTCRDLVNTKDFFINYTPFPSPKIFSSANGTIVRAMGVAPSPNPRSYTRERGGMRCHDCIGLVVICPGNTV